MELSEVAPPGFGHTKGDKKKGVEKGGTAAAFDRARKEGRFKGSKSDMFAIMWSQKNKGDKPHYKPGTNKKYKKYQEEETSCDSSYEKLKKKIGSKKKHKEPVVVEGIGDAVKKGVKRHKDAVEKKKIKNRKAVPYAALAAQNELEGKLVDESNVETQGGISMQDYDPNMKFREYEFIDVIKAEPLKKTIKEEQTRYYKDDIKGATFHDFYKKAKAAKAKKRSEAVRSDSKKHGIKFTDAKGSGRMRGGRKYYD